MKMLFKKALCLLSSAVLLCGASAITASAAPEQVSISGTSSDFSNLTPLKNTLLNFYLSSGDFEIGDNTAKGVWVKRSSSYEMPLNSTASYQWYKDGTAVSGATNYLYTISSTGKYYCKVTVKTPHTLVNRRTGKKTTVYTTEDFDTNVINVTQALTLTQQTGDGTIDTINGWYDLKVTVKGGTEPYTYQWTRDGKSYAGNKPVAAALYAGTYKCRITDSNGKWVETKPIKVSAAPLTITEQTGDGTIDTINGWYDLKVTVKGGTEPYTYQWTRDGKSYAGNQPVAAALYAGTYKCKITDANGNTVTSKPILVKYPDVKIDKYTDVIYFYSAFGKNQTAKITVKASGGYGKYVYFLEKKDSKGGWHEVAYSYTPEFEVKDEDINDNYEVYGRKPYYLDGKWHYDFFSRNINYYRVHVRGYGAKGEIAGCVDSGEITVIRENGEEYSWTTDNYYY